MEITKTLLINAACLLIPPVVVVLLLRHIFTRKIRWSAGVVALVDLVIFWTDIFYYESVWLTLFFVVIQLAMVLLIYIRLYKKGTRKLIVQKMKQFTLKLLSLWDISATFGG